MREFNERLATFDPATLPEWARCIPAVVHLARADRAYRDEVRRATVTRQQRTLIDQARRWEHEAVDRKLCPVCHQPNAGHPRCRGCSILIGPYHIEEATDGGLCRTCRRERQKRRSACH